jgi:hypothetical protein
MYYAVAGFNTSPNPVTYSSLLRECRTAALAVQQSADHAAQDQGEEPERAYDFWRDSNVNKKKMKQDMRDAAATPEQQRLATTPGPVVGQGSCPISMDQARPRLPKLKPLRRTERPYLRAPRPAFPTERWRAEHRRRCRCRGDEKKAGVRYKCQFQRLIHSLEHGWSIPFAYEPAARECDNYPTVWQDPEAVDRFMAKLEARGRAWELPDGAEAHVVNSLGLHYKLTDVDHEKPRVVMDCSASGVNHAQSPWRFRYSTTSDFIRQIQPGWYMWKLDLSSYFCTLPVAPAHQKYLTVRWRGRRIAFSSVPFGLKSAPAFATHVSCELACMMRARGIQVVTNYIDDFAGGAATREECAAALETALQLLAELGVEVNDAKTEGPTQQMEYLGVLSDTADGTVSMTLDKKDRLATALERMATASANSDEQLLSAAGRLQWFSQVHPSLRWCAQHVRAAVAPGYQARSSRLTPVTACLRGALLRAASTVRYGDATPILSWRRGSMLPPVLLRTDSSRRDGGGGHWGQLAFAYPGASASFWHSHNMVALELYSGLRALEDHWGHLWRGRVVVWALDNEGAVLSWLSGRSDNPLTQHVLGLLHAIVESCGVYLITTQVPRELMMLPDALSHVNRWWRGTARWIPGQGLALCPAVSHQGRHPAPAL